MLSRFFSKKKTPPATPKKTPDYCFAIIMRTVDPTADEILSKRADETLSRRKDFFLDNLLAGKSDEDYKSKESFNFSVTLCASEEAIQSYLNKNSPYDKYLFTMEGSTEAVRKAAELGNFSTCILKSEKLSDRKSRKPSPR